MASTTTTANIHVADTVECLSPPCPRVPSTVLPGIQTGSSRSAGLPDMRLVLIFVWLHAAIIIVAAPIESNKARRALTAGPSIRMTQLEAPDDDHSSAVANGHDSVHLESDTLGSGGVTSVLADNVTLVIRAMTAPIETSVVAPTAENEIPRISFDIDEASLKLHMIGILAEIQD